jgi:two-component system, chemotaxis family, CheB/CheR fusion protein
MAKINTPGSQKKKTRKTENSPIHSKPKNKIFPVVAIGASAGGLEAFTELVKNLTDDTGMAYIYVPHLNPDHKSLLTSILAKITGMEVQQIDKMELMEPNNIYIIPPDKGIEVTNGHIELVPRSKKVPPVSIDVLFSTLAQTHKKNVIGIILSGNGSDGAKGLSAIKAAGGITFAQDNSARSNSMPQSAFATGDVDYVLSPAKIAKELIRLSKNGRPKPTDKAAGINTPKKSEETPLKNILEILYKSVNVDFSRYKMATVKRRIHHRMLRHNIKTIAEYAKTLERKRDEISALYKDLLINVTSFFRDAEVFKYLGSTFLPSLLTRKETEGKIRIWIPACSTGEEAYSIAMLITELLEKRAKEISVQIFATDLSEQAIRDARIGEYLQNDLKQLGKKRTGRFFTKIGNKYRISKKLREMCVFAPHNILHDPPFSRIDFISCRNLLIYFEASAQKKVLTTLNFALNEGGELMLGKSETVGISSPYFTCVNKKFRIYSKKKSTGISKVPDLAASFPLKNSPGKSSVQVSRKKSSSNSTMLDSIIDSALLAEYMPACAVINKDMEILKFRGSTSLYLSHPQGNASLNILKMIRPEFSFELRSAIQTAFKSKAPVKKEGIGISSGTGKLSRMMSLDVVPLKIEWDEPLLLIIFTEQQIIEKYIDEKGKKRDSTKGELKLRQQSAELAHARAEMQAVVEAQERAYEELQAANEEIVSTSEEFQTLNEELETSKEEIEATNEELTTTNQELQMRNEQLAEAYDFSKAISETMHEPMLVLDNNHRIKSANKAFYKYFMVLENDTEGKLLYELGNHQWDIPRLHELLRNIIKKDINFYDYEITHEFPNIGKKTMLLNAARLVQKTQNEKLILLTFIDATLRPIKQKKEKEKLHNIITERTSELKRSYDEIDEKNISMKKMNKGLEAFTFISSHDLQEPLRKIKTFASLVKEEGKGLSSTGKGYLDRMEETVGRMQMLIQDLLAYSQVENAEKKLEKTDLHEIVQEVISGFTETIIEKHAEIKTELHCEINVVRFQIRQLFQNLISNSFKFSHPKRFPRILIKSALTKGNVIKIKGVQPQKKYCHITIVDNGIGFETQYKERIFEVFQRLHEFDDYKGTGIGLAICKRIVENHNGIITAKGKLNKGAQIDIYIPFRKIEG